MQKKNQARHTPMSPDNNIVFINNSAVKRQPKEFRTPPPPIWGEESEEDERPENEQFYDYLKD